MPEVKNAAIVEVFGQFAVEIEGGVKLFTTEQEASIALSEFQNGQANTETATKFAVSQGLEGKNAVGKINVIVAFLNWVDAGCPAAAPATAGDSEEKVPAEKGGKITF